MERKTMATRTTHRTPVTDQHQFAACCKHCSLTCCRCVRSMLERRNVWVGDSRYTAELPEICGTRKAKGYSNVMIQYRTSLGAGERWAKREGVLHERDHCSSRVGSRLSRPWSVENRYFLYANSSSFYFPLHYVLTTWSIADIRRFYRR